MDSRKILEQFYSGAVPPGFQPRRARAFWPRVSGTARKMTWHLVIASLMIAAWLAVHLHYYNLLVDLEYNTKAAWAQVEAQLQRRFYIQQNLTQIVIDYSQYEKDLLIRLTEMRTSAMSGHTAAKASKVEKQHTEPLQLELKKISPPELNKLFSNIILVAEQYPQLKLTENFQQFSEALINTENEIAERIMNYNEAVNVYTTTLSQFPGNIFGAISDFPSYKFHEPDKETLSFQPVKY